MGKNIGKGIFQAENNNLNILLNSASTCLQSRECLIGSYTLYYIKYRDIQCKTIMIINLN